jgi:hypothetical protein
MNILMKTAQCGALIFVALLVLAYDNQTTGSKISTTPKESQIDGNRVILTSEYISASNRINVLARGLLSDNSNCAIAKVSITESNLCSYDYLMSYDSRVLWVYILHTNKLSKRLELYLYPYIRDQSKGVNYSQVMRNKLAGSSSVDIISYCNVTALIHEQVKRSFEIKRPISLGRNAQVSDIKMISTNSSDVTVSGKLGTNYSFSTSISLRENNACVSDIVNIERNHND